MQRTIDLTKIVEHGGQKRAACAFKDTEMCRIHKGNCAECKVFEAILEKLNLFETIYNEGEDENE